MGEVDSKAGQLLVTYLLHTVQDPFCTATQLSFENSFHTLLFVFWWTKSQHHRSRLWKRLYGRSSLHCRSAITHPSPIHSSRSVLCSKTVQFPNSFHTLFFVSWWTKSWHPRSRLRKRLYGRSSLHAGHSSLIHSSRSVQHSKTVQFPKQFSHSSLCFLVAQVLAPQIKAEEETLWVKLTPKQVSCQSSISYTQFKIHSVQQDSSVSKTIFPLLSLFFGGPSLSITDQG